MSESASSPSFRTGATADAIASGGAVAGVPYEVSILDGELRISVGRYDPAAAGELRIDPRSGTASLLVAVAGPDGNSVGPGLRAYFDLYARPRAADGPPEYSAGQCGAPLTLGPRHDPYQTTCDQAEGHYPGTGHTGPHPLGTRPGDRITWRGGGRCAGDPLPHEITSEAWQE
jgi:hypothetical protein